MITIQISTRNTSFDGKNKEVELARILIKLANRIQDGHSVSPVLRDINGNAVGTVEGIDDES